MEQELRVMRMVKRHLDKLPPKARVRVMRSIAEIVEEEALQAELLDEGPADDPRQTRLPGT